MSNTIRTAPPDQDQREQALDPHRSILVQAPAGSGKTDLLTRRFLRLLAEVDDPAQIVAITFTKAAAAEMRHRIVSELEKAAQASAPQSEDQFSMESLARRAFGRSLAQNWNLIDLPAQLRISTIDSFCRELALQQPLLAGLGGGLDIAEQPEEQYRRAANRTIARIEGAGSTTESRLRTSIETLLMWRDNNWQDLEGLLVEMLKKRDQWMQDFVLEREQDWEALRERLERPLFRGVSDCLAKIANLMGERPGAREESLELARFACQHGANDLFKDLAELPDLPSGPFSDPDGLEHAKSAYWCLADLLLTVAGSFRKLVNVNLGFPADRKREKVRAMNLIHSLETVEGFQDSLSDVKMLPPVRYTDDDWTIVRACFTLLRQAAAELKVVFAESGAVDYVEVAQLAQRVLQSPDQSPTDAAIAIAGDIRHLLVDEFQDTSRKQHKLIAGIVAAWPDSTGRTVFVVGDPMQSIYLFRDADAELFPRVKDLGLDLSMGEPLQFAFVPLTSNFRTAPQLVDAVNEMFVEVFAERDGSGIQFSSSQPARAKAVAAGSHFNLHVEFMPQSARGSASNPDAVREREAAAQLRESALNLQTQSMISLVRSHVGRMDQARARGDKYRIAILGRTRSALAPIAQALRDASIPFRAVDLEPLSERPEVFDVLSLARALFNGEDRVAWLGVLRAPWCGLSLDDLHAMTSGDDPNLLRTPIPELLKQRTHLLSSNGRRAVGRVIAAVTINHSLRHVSPDASVGTWLKQVWEQLGGAACVNATALTNLDLLWKCLDALPGGETDLLGNTLSMALQKLTAQPDPAATSDCGVQLMTIHKSKGLEFEVVIVPELHATTRRTSGRMLTWLERGLAGPCDSDEVTEFLIAPVQPKGSDRGATKGWVDRVYRERELQEIRRILYVAATRAREELHFFMRPAYRKSKDRELILPEPGESLLSAAWPALEDEVRARFDEWRTRQAKPETVSLAAASESNLIEMPSPSDSEGKPALIHRLPSDYEPPPTGNGNESRQVASVVDGALYRRHEGGVASRALGSAVHAFFEELADLRTSLDWESARAALPASASRNATRVRVFGIPAVEAHEIVKEALELTLRASRDPVTEWMLSPHPDASREAQWAGMIAGSLRTVRADLVFRAGNAPQVDGDDTWWIVDYKTAQAGNMDPEQAMREMRPLFAPQIEIYAQVLRNLKGEQLRIHTGLYYPRMLRFDWWTV